MTKIESGAVTPMLKTDAVELGRTPAARREHLLDQFERSRMSKVQVYRGTKGANGSTPHDLVDANIAIAAKQLCCFPNLFLGINWDPPIYINSGGSTSSGSSANNSVNGIADCVGVGNGGGVFSGTVDYTGPETCRNANFSIPVLNSSNIGSLNNAQVVLVISSSIDGTLLNINLTQMNGTAPPGPGVYDYPFTVPASVGATITVQSIIASSVGGGDESHVAATITVGSACHASQP